MRTIAAALLFAGVLDAQDPVEVAFKARDLDKDGKLTREELDAPMLFRSLDRNRDGFVTLEEARAFYAGGKAPAPPMTTSKNVRYARMDGVDENLLSLDVYRPATGEKHPVLVMIHGGAWAFGDKTGRGMGEHKVPHFVGAGYVFISINYRLSPKVVHPAHVQDVAKALAWVHDNADQHGGDKDRIFLMGHSAGAHLAALVAIDDRYLKAEGKSPGILKGVIPLDGAAYDLPKLMAAGPALGKRLYTRAFGEDENGWRDASPYCFVGKDKGTPPMLIFYAGRRATAADAAKALAQRLREAEVPATAVHAPDRDHAAMNRCIGEVGDPYTALVMRFLKDPKAFRP